MTLALLIGSDTKRLKTIFETLSKVGWQLNVITNPQTIMQVLEQKDYQTFFCDEALKGASIGGLQAIISRKVKGAAFYVIRSTDKPLRTPTPVTGEVFYPPSENYVPQPQMLVGTGPDINKTFVPFAGNTSMVSAVDVIQAMCMDKRNGVIDYDKGKTGLIYVHEGLIEHALFFNEGETVKGLKALGALIQIQETPFRVLNYQPPGASSVKLPADTALTEAARLADEAEKYQKVIMTIRQICPSVTAIAIGYPMASKPNQGYGDADSIFVMAKTLLEKTRATVKGRLNEFFLSTDSTAYSLTHLDEGNLLIVSAPAQDRIRLQEAVMKTAVASYA